MSTELKPVVPFDTFAAIDMRLGRVTGVSPALNTPKPAYVLEIDFGKFGKRTSVGRFTKHAAEELKDKLVIGVLNFEPRPLGDHVSECLVLGVQYPGADSGEATILTPLANAKIGGKVF
jgi:tRNA-binding protein